MSAEQGLFGELRSLIHAGESTAQFCAIMAWFERATPDHMEASARLWVPYALEHMSVWSVDTCTLPRAQALRCIEHNLPYGTLVRGMDLSETRYFQDEVLCDLARAPCIDRLHTLDLSRCQAKFEHIEPLYDAPHLESLRVLTMPFNLIGYSARARMIHASCLRYLTHLDMQRCVLNTGEIIGLCESELLGHVRHLSFQGNKIGDGCVDALISAPCFDHLDVLDLSFTTLSTKAMTRVERAFHHGRMVHDGFFRRTPSKL